MKMLPAARAPHAASLRRLVALANRKLRRVLATKAVSLHLIMSRADKSTPVCHSDGLVLWRAGTEESHDRSNTQYHCEVPCLVLGMTLNRAISCKSLPLRSRHRRAAPARTPTNARGTCRRGGRPDKTRDSGKIGSSTA